MTTGPDRLAVINADGSFNNPAVTAWLTTFVNALIAASGGGGGGGGDPLTDYSEQVASLPDYPTEFPPTSHGHPSTAITDSTATGRAVLVATNAAAVRTAAGLSNVDDTSDLNKPVSTAQSVINADLWAAIAGFAQVGLSYPMIPASTSTVIPDRATWIAANCPGYDGPVIWNTLAFVDFPQATIEAEIVDGDIAWRRLSS